MLQFCGHSVQYKDLAATPQKHLNTTKAEAFLKCSEQFTNLSFIKL